jgi:hypothetical protein
LDPIWETNFNYQTLVDDMVGGQRTSLFLFSFEEFDNL